MIHDHMQASYSALMGRYPGNPRYLAAAVREGFKFEPPDVNTSNVGFSLGSTKKSIQVGLKRIEGIGDGAAAAIVRNQPFASVEDMIERVGSRYIKQGDKVNTVEILAATGALESLGIDGERDDETDFRLLNFVMRPETPAGQRDFRDEVNRIVMATPNNRGIGIFWWEPAVTGGLRSRGFFDDDGNALPVINVFDRFTRK